MKQSEAWGAGFSTAPQRLWARVKGAAAALALAALAALVLLPIGYIFFGAFRTAAPGDPHAAFTLANWATALGSRDYLVALGNTILLACVVSAISFAIGASLAWIVVRTDAPGRRIFSLLILLPMMISNLITSLAWISLAAPNAGFINAYARLWFGWPTLFDIYSFAGIVLVDVLHYSSFSFLAIYAALRSIDSSLEEASYMLGVGVTATGLRMTLPLLSPTIATTLLANFVFVAENFSAPTLLGAPVGFQTLPSIIYLNMTVAPAQPTLAAASGALLLAVACLGVYWQRRISKNAFRFVTVGGKGGRSRTIGLGAWRYLATACLAIFFFLAVVLPYCVLLLSSLMSFVTPRLTPAIFTLDNYRSLFAGDNITPIVNSLLYSTLGGLLVTGVYVGISLARRKLSRGQGAALDYVTIFPTAMPALVLGVGLIWAFVDVRAPIYGTPIILILAYFIRYVGFGVRHAGDALDRISPELSEAARTCGASPLRAARDVTLPIAAPSILSLWTILFIYIFMEISATIILYSPATRTLPTILWNDMASGSQTAAFAVASLQATLTFLLLIATDRRFGSLSGALKS